eukprot:333941_1
MKSIIEMINTKSVLLSYININNNYASQYGVFTGDLSGDFKIEHSNIINNMNNGPFQENILFNIDSFTDLTIDNTQFTNNNNGTTLLNGILNGAVAITDSNFVNNDDLNTLMDINGVSTLNISVVNIKDNTAEDGILFDGESNGDVNINEFEFRNNNFDNILIDGQTLMSYTNFINFVIDYCSIDQNDGDYLFKMLVSGNIEFNHCNIRMNDIDKNIIRINQTNSDGNLQIKNSNISQNENSVNLLTNSVESLIDVWNINNVLLSSLIIEDNYATNYFTFSGSGNGSITIENTNIMGNTNNGPLNNTILMNTINFVDLTVYNVDITNNDQATNVFKAEIHGDVIIDDMIVKNNDASEDIFVIDGIQSLSLFNIKIIENTARDIIQFYGTNNDNVVMTNFEFGMNNEHNHAIHSKTLILFDSFVDMNITSCDIYQNAGQYIFKIIVLGDITLKACDIDSNHISDNIIHSTLSGGDFMLELIHITNNNHGNHSISSLITASIMSSTSMTDIIIKDNFATQFFEIEGNFTGDILMSKMDLINNINTNTSANNIFIQAYNFNNINIQHSMFFNNDKFFDKLFSAKLNGDVDIVNTNFINNDGDLDLLKMVGVNSLNITNSNISHNNADRLLQFYGLRNGNIDIVDIELINNNYNNKQHKTLFYFTQFVDVSVSDCNAMMNNANYFFQLFQIYGDILFEDCSISMNNINQMLVEVIANGGDFSWMSSNITYNHRNYNQAVKSTELLFDISNVTNLLVDKTFIQNNNVTQIMRSNGNNIGTLTLSAVQIVNNMNQGPLPHTILFDIMEFRSATIDDSVIINNVHATNTFVLELSGGSMNIINSSFIDNEADNTLFNVTGINHTLTILSSGFDGNNVFDMLVFYSDDADINIDTLMVQDSNILQPGNSIMSLNNFNDVNVSNILMINNDVRKYLIYGTIFGDAIFKNTQFLDNKCDFEILRVFGDKNNNASSIR